jgi:phytoene synthase
MRLISKAGKTFYFATLWLERSVRWDAALAYDFCRCVDDIADGEPAREDRDSYLRTLASAVLNGEESHELVRPLLPLLARFPQIREPLHALVEACRTDVPDMRISDENDLERYAHGVAGNVGLIMYPILGGSSPVGRQYAADLGKAMQYTNICRDVLEDLRRGRIYLPASWVGEKEVRTLLAGDGGSEVTVRAVQRLLALANEYYERGLSGLQFLASQNRFAIKVAARCYAAIGDRVIQNGRLSPERAVVPLTRKIVIACSMRLYSEPKKSPHRVGT